MEAVLNGTKQDIAKELVKFIEGDILDAIGLIGNFIFAIVTVVLGMKYIWSGAEGRSQVLESLPAFVLGVIFFYLADTIVDFMLADESLGGLSSATTWNSAAGRVLKIIYTVVKYGSIIGMVVIGLKYMFASADGRAEMKQTLGSMVIGLIFVFSASNIVEFIVASADEII